MPTLRLDGDARGAVRAMADVAKAAKEIPVELDKGTKSAKSLERAAADIVRKNEGPQDRYNRQIKELAVHLNAGRLTFQQAETAAGRYRRELEGVATKQQSAFGGQAGAMITSYFAGLIGPSAVVALATRALANYNAELDKVNAGLQGDRAGLGELMQLAITSGFPEAKAKALVAEAKQIFASGATRSLGEAGHLVFGLESATITDPRQRATIAQLQNYGIVPDAKGFAPSIAALRSAFPGVAPDKLLSMGVVAGVPSPGGADQLIQHAGKSAEQARALGWSPEFTLAATSLLSRAYGGASEGGVRLEQFMKQLEHFGFHHDPTLKGQDPFAVLQKIAAGGTSQENLRKFVGGRMEAMQGARTLIGNVEELRALTDTAGRGGVGLLDQMVGIAQNIPEIDAATSAIGAQNRRDLSRLGPATTASLLTSVRDELAAGRGGRGTALTDFAFWTMRMQSEAGQRETLRGFTTPTGSQGLSEELLESIRRHLQNLDSKTPPPTPGRTGRQE